MAAIQIEKSMMMMSIDVRGICNYLCEDLLLLEGFPENGTTPRIPTLSVIHRGEIDRPSASSTRDMNDATTKPRRYWSADEIS